MKRAILTTLLILATSSIVSARGGHFGHHGWGYHQQGGYQRAIISKLTQEQKDDLIYMYQEEKLARDVYITLGKKWGARVFLNIQKSEQNHMNAIKNLLNRYSLRVPISSNNIGRFKNEELQALYNDLIAKGKLSLKDALEVGVTIEETDIADLEEKIDRAPSDIARVYSRLLRGSYNHLRAFNRNLNRR